MPEIIVALDHPKAQEALRFAEQLAPSYLKVGKALFTRAGPAILAQLHDLGHRVFLDLKFHDIPNTVADACRAAAEWGVWMLDVHALGGAEMMQAAASALAEYETPPKLIAVTVLTSMNEAALRAVGLAQTPAALALHLAKMAQAAGLAGVVTSGHEVRAIKTTCGTDFWTITPGIRPTWAAKNDQSRVMTPEAAAAEGSDFLVIGRPITQHPQPQQALERIRQALAAQDELRT